MALIPRFRKANFLLDAREHLAEIFQGILVKFLDLSCGRRIRVTALCDSNYRGYEEKQNSGFCLPPKTLKSRHRLRPRDGKNQHNNATVMPRLTFVELPCPW